MPILPDMDYVRSIPDPAPSWRWVVRMPPLPRGGGRGNGGGNRLSIDMGTNIGNGPLGLPSDALFETPLLPFGIVEQIDFQTQSIDSDDRFQAAAKLKYPRFLSMSAMSMSFYEDVSYSTTQYLAYWKSLIVDDDHNYAIPADYKRNIYLFAFNTIDNSNPTFVGYMRGCWPTSLGGYSYTHGASDKVTVTCEFAVDEAHPFASGVGMLRQSPDIFTSFAARLNQRQ